MSALKFLTRAASGAQQLIAAITTSAGAGDGNKILATGADGKIHSSFFPTGFGDDTGIAVASENLAAGNFVNVYDNAGAATVRKADASNGRDANGFVLAAVTSGANATVYRMGSNNQLAGLTTGATYYLSATTAGTATTAAPTTSGQMIQELGSAFNPTTLVFTDRGFVEIV